MEGRIAPRQNVRGADCTDRAWRNRIFSRILRHIGRKEPTLLFVPPVYDLLQPQGFFKIEEENISSINRNIRQLENDKAYAALSAELARTIRSAEDILATAKAQLKEAKTAREQRRKEKELNAQEEAELIRESQFQKAEYKRLERSWKARITTLQTQTEDWERRISALKSERKTRSAALQQKLFEQFGMLNYRGEVKNLCEIFGQTVHKTPPAGAGECAAPNCCNKLICTDGNLLPWPSSGGVIPQDRDTPSRPLLSGLQRKVRTYTATHAARSTSRGKPHVEKNAGTLPKFGDCL